MPHLFEPLTLRGLTLRNRIVVSPMCQYSANEGFVNDWHFVHLSSRAVGGAGLVCVEATAVSPEGRISPDDLGLWEDVHGVAFERVVRFVKGEGAALGVQLAHAGRKASSKRPWDGFGSVPPEEGGWEPIGPGDVPFSPSHTTPRAMTTDDVHRVVEDFRRAAFRARRAGFDVVEVHAAHGYLIHEFLSPLTNTRTDEYGGSFENRIRLTLEVFDDVRRSFGGTLGVRISGTDWVDGGWSINETVELARRLKERGAQFVHISSGGVSPLQKITLGPEYQVPLAKAVRERSGLATFAVGLITEAQQAEAVLARGDADLVALARAFLYNPRWGWSAAAALQGQVQAQSPYWRCLPKEAGPIFGPDARIGMR